MDLQREYLSKNHAKYLLKYHVILVCEYRRKALVGNVGMGMKHILLDIAQKSDFDIEVMETDKDHVHLLVAAPPKLSPLMIVRRLKQESSARMATSPAGGAPFLLGRSQHLLDKRLFRVLCRQRQSGNDSALHREPRLKGRKRVITLQDRVVFWRDFISP